MYINPTREQLPFYNHFMRLINNDDFIIDIDLLRISKVDIRKSTYENVEVIEMLDGDDIVNGDEIPSPLHQIMMKHNLPLVMEDFIYHYVAHNEVALDKLRNGVYILDHKAMKASGNNRDETHNYQASYINDAMQNKYIEVTLAIPVHATITQITDTIAQHKQFIKDRQTQANDNKPIKRVKVFPEKILRDKEIMRLYKKGIKPNDIANALLGSTEDPLTGSDISKIIYKQKNKQ